MIKKINLFPIFFMSLFCFSFYAMAQVALPTPLPEPQSLEQALGFFPTLLQFLQNGQWLLFGATVTMLGVFAIKKYLLAKWDVPRGAMPFISAGLGIFVGVSGAILGGANAQAAVLAVLSGPLASAFWSSGLKYFFPEAAQAGEKPADK